MLTGPGSTSLSYDPAMRLYQTVAGGTTTRMAYDGLDLIAEYSGSDVIQRRYVHGPGPSAGSGRAYDQPLVWYEGAGTSDRRFLSSDERGSIISVTDSSGALLRINRYDEYGNPQGTNLGLWGYTGQAWLPGMGGWYYKARVYDRELGRFLQPDPIGYWGGLNLYAYVGNDPVNFVDPLGLQDDGDDGPIIDVCSTGYWVNGKCANRPDLVGGGIIWVSGGDLPLIGGPGGFGPDGTLEDFTDILDPIPAIAETQCALSPTPAAATPHGETKGEHPVWGRGGYNTDLPGGWRGANVTFVGLRRLAGDFSLDVGPDMFRPWILYRSQPSGIQYRLGSDFRPRIDIPANTFQLTVRETIHFTEEEGRICPMN